MKKFLIALVAVVALVSCVACGGKHDEKSAVQEIIEQAQKMSLKELAQKAVEESKGKTFNGVGNSSRGKTALPYFVEYLKTIDPTYTLEYTWQQPKNNNIFAQLTADGAKKEGTFAMTLIQDGNQIQSKMVNTGVLDTFIPKEWAEANGTTADKVEGFLPLQTLNKVFMVNSKEGKTFTNIWDFVADGEHGLFMDIDSEVVGKNFLYTLTKDEYATQMKAAYDALPAGAAKDRITATISSVEGEVAGLGLNEVAKYSLAFIKLWVTSYAKETDDGPICTTLSKDSSAGQFGLLVYSKIRSITESSGVSANNITIAAAQDNYVGLGGYAYCHYLFVTDNSPLPWTACAFIAYMTCVNNDTANLVGKEVVLEKNADGSPKKTDTITAEKAPILGFIAWGKDMGGYSSNPQLLAANEAVHHHTATNEFACKQDKGYDWWKDHLVIEDPSYCAKVSFTVGAWIDMLDRYTVA